MSKWTSWNYSLDPSGRLRETLREVKLWGQSRNVQFSSVQFSRSVVSDSLWPHELQHARPPCPSPTPGVHSDSRPLSRWCHPAISSSVVPCSSCPQSLPASGSFPVSQLFSWGGQSTGVSALESFLPKNTQDWSPLEWKMVWLDLLAVQGTLKSLLQHHSPKASILQCSAFFTVQLSHQVTLTPRSGEKYKSQLNIPTFNLFNIALDCELFESKFHS